MIHLQLTPSLKDTLVPMPLSFFVEGAYHYILSVQLVYTLGSVLSRFESRIVMQCVGPNFFYLNLFLRY